MGWEGGGMELMVTREGIAYVEALKWERVWHIQGKDGVQFTWNEGSNRVTWDESGKVRGLRLHLAASLPNLFPCAYLKKHTKPLQ